MTRTILIPEKTNILLSIPEEYVGKEIEITCLALDEFEQKRGKKTMADFFGTIDDQSYKALKESTEEARKEWDRTIL